MIIWTPWSPFARLPNILKHRRKELKNVHGKNLPSLGSSFLGMLFCNEFACLHSLPFYKGSSFNAYFFPVIYYAPDHEPNMVKERFNRNVFVLFSGSGDRQI